MEIKVVKFHAQGNSYIVIEDLERNLENLYSRIAIILSDKSFGIGSDGILVFNKSNIAKARMRVFNPDGSEAEISGNGLRIFATYLNSKGILKEEDYVEVGGNKGGKIAKAKILKDGSVQINLGKGVFLGEIEINVAKRVIKGCKVSLGNPHFVIICKSKEEAKSMLNEIGSLIENHEAFPNRTNVEFVYVEEENKIISYIWERGAGATLSSGTGASASAFALYKLNKVGNNVVVEMPGGKINVKIDEEDNIEIFGKAEKILEGIAYINP